MKKLLLVAPALLSLSAGVVLGGRRRSSGDAATRLASPRYLEHAVEVERGTRRFLMYFLLPAWLAAGFLDYLCHRRTRIEATAGTHESAVHALMLLQSGLPTLMGLFLNVNAGVLLTAIAAALVHEATAFWDVAYAEPRRKVTPNEQHIHSFLEVIPFVGTAFLAVLHWEQARALVGAGDEPARFALQLKRPPLPRRYVAGILTAWAASGLLPYAEEFWRCLRARKSLAPLPKPAVAATPTLRVVDADRTHAQPAGARGGHSG